MKALKHGEETLCIGREETILFLLEALREEFPAEKLTVEPDVEVEEDHAR
jgi:hypothetical protein